MNGHEKDVLEEALDKYFSSFELTQALASELVDARKNEIDVLILLCARLDALASGSVREGSSSKGAFTDFLRAHAGRGNIFDFVSVGDLYYDLGYHLWAIEGTIPKPGRLHRFSRLDAPILYLLDGANLPLTVNDSSNLLKYIMTILAQHFRVRPRQHLSKPRLAKIGRLKSLISASATHSRFKGVASNLPSAIDKLLVSKRVATILYEKFRSEAIHGAKVQIDTTSFFVKRDVYWEPYVSAYGESYELIQFPAQFLIQSLKSSIQTYRQHLLAKKQIPPDVFSHAFDDALANWEFLDESLLPEGGDLRFKIAD